MVQLAQLWSQFDSVEQLLWFLLFQVVELVGILLNIIQLILKRTLICNESIAVYALLNDLLIQESCAAGSQSRVWLKNHPDKCAEFVRNLVARAFKRRKFSSYHFLV